MLGRIRSKGSKSNRRRSVDARQNGAASGGSAGGPTPQALIDKCAIIPLLVCVFATTVAPLEYQLFGLSTSETRLDTRILWPVLTAISVTIALLHRRQLRSFVLPPSIGFLLAYLAFAGASVVWSFNAAVSATRYAQQVMVVTSIVIPSLLAGARSDMMRGLFLWCFGPAAILNLFFLFSNDPLVVAALKGYPGLFLGKNYLGEFAGITFILALHETFYSGLRRVSGLVILGVASWLLFMSNSKTAFGLAIAAPILAGLTLLTSKAFRLSPAAVLLSIPICYLILSTVSNFSIYRLSYMIYGDSSMTGRSVIWDFADYEVARRPLLGWGYQSFWLAGPGAPSIVDAPGWVKTMPDGHNGYVDTKLELGYTGLWLLVAFVFATLHGVGRVARRDLPRAGALLSLALFVIVYNFSESLWMRGYEFLWVVFLLVAAEIGRYWRTFPRTEAGYRLPRTPRVCSSLQGHGLVGSKARQR